MRLINIINNILNAYRMEQNFISKVLSTLRVVESSLSSAMKLPKDPMWNYLMIYSAKLYVERLIRDFQRISEEGGAL